MVQFIYSLFKSGKDQKNNVESNQKAILITVICIIGICALVPLGILALAENNLTLGYFDLSVAVVLLAIIIFLKKTGYNAFYSYLGLTIIGTLFVYLFSSGGSHNTGHLWFYTFPLVASFLLGSKKGAFFTSILFALAILIFALQDSTLNVAQYSKYFKLRFIFSFLVVSTVAFFYENARESDKKQLVANNADLQGLIRDLKQSKDELKETSLLLETILDSIPDIIGIQDRRHRIIRYNEAGYNYLNTSYEGSQKKKCYELIGREGPCEICATSESYETKEPANIEKYLEENDVWLDVRSYPVLDEEGEIKYIVEHLRDITKHKKAEVELQQSEERYRSLIENTIEGFFTCEIPSGQFLFLNEQACDIYGYTLLEGLKLTIWDVISPIDHERIRERIKDRMEGKKLRSERQIYTSVLKDGSNIRVEISTSLISLHDCPVVQGVLRDVTEQEQLEQKLQQSKKMEAIGLLAGGVAHDLNNVLSGIVSYPDIILMDLPEDSPLRKPIQTIHNSGQKAAEIVQDLLTLARRGVSAKSVLNLNDVITEYLQSPEYEKLRSYHPDVSIGTNLDKNLLNIEGSSVQLVKMIMNLVSNSAEAQPIGGEITISTYNQHVDTPIQGYEIVKEGDFVVLEIKDTGLGIAAEDLNRIFEPFYTKKVMGKSGTGLGMAVVWGTIHDHDGYIDVDSTEGVGTTFSLFLPVMREKITNKELVPVEEYLGAKEKILVVDDVIEQREIAVTILSKLNYSVTSVSSGEEAITYMKDNSADLLVLDMIMDSGIDGFETYRKIKQFHPNQKAIIASGYSETDRVKKSQKLGAGQYIRKPYTLEKIGIAVKKELSK